MFVAQCVVYTSQQHTHSWDDKRSALALGKESYIADIRVRSKCDPVSCVEPQFNVVLWVNLLLLFNRNTFMTSKQGCVCRWHKTPLFLFSDLVLLFISTSAFYVDWVSCVSLCDFNACVCVCACVFSEDTTDLVFEEFKRSYLKGIIGEDDDSPAEPWEPSPRTTRI